MKLAVMQPYLFPYIGYFQLIYAADLFLIYDDVAYIKQGYINRNNIMTSKGALRFTVSVPGASSNKLISELKFSPDVAKVLKTIEQSYSKSPYFEVVFPIIKEILQSKDRSISSVCLKSYEMIFSYLGIGKEFIRTSSLKYDREATACERLVSFCHMFSAQCYINSPGGKSLYSKSDFATHGVQLDFIESLPLEYNQGFPEFVANLSIIDVLMNCSPEKVKCLLRSFKFS